MVKIGQIVCSDCSQLIWWHTDRRRRCERVSVVFHLCFCYVADVDGFARLLRNVQIPLETDAARRLFCALTLNRSDGEHSANLKFPKLFIYVTCILLFIVCKIFYVLPILVGHSLHTHCVSAAVILTVWSQTDDFLIYSYLQNRRCRW